MNGHPYAGLVFLGILGVIALAGIITGAILAANDYSSAGAFSIAAACVGVLGTLAAQRAANGHNGDMPLVGGKPPPILHGDASPPDES